MKCKQLVLEKESTADYQFLNFFIKLTNLTLIQRGFFALSCFSENKNFSFLNKNHYKFREEAYRSLIFKNFLPHLFVVYNLLYNLKLENKVTQIHFGLDKLVFCYFSYYCFNSFLTNQNRQLRRETLLIYESIVLSYITHLTYFLSFFHVEVGINTNLF